VIKMSQTTIVTCTSPVNIATIKYWGKRDEKLILPLNSSLSVTLNQDDLKTTTSAMVSPSFESDRLWLNGKEENVTSVRIQNVLSEIRKRATKNKDLKVHIVSENNFPTAAGLASSASGFCCLVFTLAQIYGVEGDLSGIARIGSGSACRSMFGGFAAWEMGKKDDGSDSIGVQIKPETHWPSLNILVLVVSDEKKGTSSTVGMQKTVETSELLKDRVTNIVPKRMLEMEEAIKKKDFQTFADLTMKDSDNFHDCCRDTKPPIIYMNDISRSICDIIHKYNKFSGKLKAGYTYDAGPNAVVFVEDENLVEFTSLILHYFPTKTVSDEKYFNKPDLLKKAREFKLDEKLLEAIGKDVHEDALRYILHTTSGPGPQVLNTDQHLIDEKTGLPK
jgi:diphosphomevalonate decarboxylase